MIRDPVGHRRLAAIAREGMQRAMHMEQTFYFAYPKPADPVLDTMDNP